MMIRFNQDIRDAIEQNHIKYWEVADKYGITDGNFSKKLRKELSIDEKNKLMSIIDELIKERSV